MHGHLLLQDLQDHGRVGNLPAAARATKHFNEAVFLRSSNWQCIGKLSKDGARDATSQGY